MTSSYDKWVSFVLLVIKHHSVQCNQWLFNHPGSHFCPLVWSTRRHMMSGHISRRLESGWRVTNSCGYRLLLCGGYSRYVTREPVPEASSTLDMSVVTSPVLFSPWCRPKKKRGQVLRCRWQPVVSVHVRRIEWSEYFHPRSASNARCIQWACFHRVH